MSAGSLISCSSVASLGWWHVSVRTPRSKYSAYLHGVELLHVCVQRIYIYFFEISNAHVRVTRCHRGECAITKLGKAYRSSNVVEHVRCCA